MCASVGWLLAQWRLKGLGRGWLGLVTGMNVVPFMLNELCHRGMENPEAFVACAGLWRLPLHSFPLAYLHERGSAVIQIMTHNYRAGCLAMISIPVFFFVRVALVHRGGQPMQTITMEIRVMTQRGSKLPLMPEHARPRFPSPLQPPHVPPSTRWPVV